MDRQANSDEFLSSMACDMAILFITGLDPLQ